MLACESRPGDQGPFRLRIHRGAREIGGTCVELAAGGRTLLLDLGLPLWASGPEDVALPDVPGIATGDAPGFLGIVLSHGHLDHCGLVSRAHPATPLYLGSGARRLLAAAADFAGRGPDVRHAVPYRPGDAFSLGPFRVMPFANDHSAYDACSLLIEAAGKRLFYTGDIRGHGRTAYRFERLLARGPRGVDALLLEGTTIGRDLPRSHREAELEGPLLATLRRTAGLALVGFSGQNIDRLVTVYKAARRAGRTLVLDAYTAHLLAALPDATLPGPHWPGIGVYLSGRWKRQLAWRGRFDLIAPFRRVRVFLEDLARQPERYVLQARPTLLADLDRSVPLSGATWIGSVWPGYMERSDDPIGPWCRRHGIPIVHHHTSGHADPHDLRRLVEALAPRRVIPVHTAAPERYASLFQSVQVVSDGEWFDLSRERSEPG